MSDLVVCQEKSFSETGRWASGVRAMHRNVLRTRSVGPFVRRSEPAPTSRSKTWRSDSSSPCSAANRSDRDSGASIASSGCGSPTGGPDAPGALPRPPRDRNSLAPAGLPRFLDLEVPSRASGSTAGRLRACRLVRTMALANPLWGAPRIHGELLKLGLNISQRTVARLMPRRPKPPSQSWRTFLNNHLADLVSVDFFVVPTATFRVLYVFVVLLHHRRQVVHFNVTDSPTAAWTAQQLVEAFPDDSAPRYILRDRDGIYGGEFRRRVTGMRIVEVLTAPRSPWQNPFVERVIGTIRRELLDHVIVLNEGHLRRRLRSYLRYYHSSRRHLALEKDAPEPRAVEPPEQGRVVALSQVGGLHHRYIRRAA